MSKGLLSVVDEQGNIIGTETREKIHREGLLHRSVHVWFYTPDGNLIFQRRKPNSDTFPGLLDATVGGHVEIGQDYLEAAIAEAREETGVEIKAAELKFIDISKPPMPVRDETTQTLNYHLKASFAYLYDRDVAELNNEKGTSFEKILIERLFALDENERKKFIPSQLGPKYLEIFRKIRNLL